MRGTLVIARFGFLELTRGKLFWIILVMALAVNFILSWGGYYISAKSRWAEDIQWEHQNQFEHSHAMQQAPLGFNPDDPDLPISMIKNLIRWMVYVDYIFFGNFLAIFGAIGLLGSELENRSIYTLISKPLSRSNIFFGKLLGLIFALLVYSVAMIVAAQLFFLLSGAGRQLSLFPAAGIGFINFMIFGILATTLSVRFRPILAGVLSVIILWSSTFAGTTAIKTIGRLVFRLSEHTANNITLVLPAQKSIGGYAIHFLFDKYYQATMSELPREWLELLSKDPKVLVQPVIWLVSILLIGYLSFFRREFD